MKKRIPRPAKWILFLAVLWVSRGWLYRQVVAYQPIETRYEYLPKNASLNGSLENKWDKISFPGAKATPSMPVILHAAQ